MSKFKETCYMCSSLATSVEHAPPRCFFPKAQYPENYRISLITVPSCSEHNQDTSHLDEIMQLLFNLASRKNHPATLIRDKLLNSDPQNLGRQQAKISKITKKKFTINVGESLSSRNFARFDITHLHNDLNLFVKKISCAIYHKDTNEKINTNAIHDICFLTGPHNDSNEALDLTYSACLLFELCSKSFKGSNPDVFQYRVMSIESDICLQFIFYESMIITNRVRLI